MFVCVCVCVPVQCACVCVCVCVPFQLYTISFTQLFLLIQQYYTASIPSPFPCSTADSANSIVCDVSGKGGKEEEERKDKEGELTSCESVQERRRQENENSALEAFWEKAARYWPEHVSLNVCVLLYIHTTILFMCVLIHCMY